MTIITLSNASGNPYIDGLTLEPGFPTPVIYTPGSSITYFFDTDQRAWSDLEQGAVTSAWEAWDRLINLNIEETNDRSAATVLMQISDLGPDTLAQATLPGDFQGNNKTNLNALNDIDFGGDSYVTLLHEIGHNLGIMHPHDATTFPGVGVSEDQNMGDLNMNQNIWTVMSYVVGYEREPVTGKVFGGAMTPMTLDIAAAQFAYGAAESNTGDDTYSITTQNAVGTGWTAIWDTGGTDTISAEGATGATTIDLRAATLEGSSPGGHVSWMDGIQGGYTIANGVIVENVIGGNGIDTVIGNQANNIITGLNGNDSLDGGAGQDTATYAGSRSDYLVLNASTGKTLVVDIVAGRDGKDSLQNVENIRFGTEALTLAAALVEPADSDNSAFQVYRFYNTETGSHFFTTSIAERNSVVETLDVLSFEGNAFDSNVTEANGTAVFRFYNKDNGVHFYTAAAEEAASLRLNAGFKDEGISYYAANDDSNGGTALYRFYNTQNDSHFYTVSEAERDNIINTIGHYKYEDVAFYVDAA